MCNGGYVVVKGAAGLGNRMLSALSGTLYAQLSGRKLFVDWRDGLFSDNGSNAFNMFFRSPLVDPDEPAPEDDSVYPGVWAENLALSATDLVYRVYPHLLGEYSTAKLTSLDVSRLEYDEKVLVFWCWDDQIRMMRHHFTGAFGSLRGLSTFEIQRDLAKRHLVLTPELQQNVDEFKAAHWSDDVIGVHIRYTDLKIPLLKFHRSLERLLSESPARRVFLATDNEAVQEEFQKRYANLFVRPKHFLAGGKPLHLNPASGNVAERAAEAVIEMYLLAECHQLVCARWSTFSYMAQLLSDLPKSRIIDLDRFNPLFHAKKWAQRRNIAVPAIARIARRLYRRAKV